MLKKILGIILLIILLMIFLIGLVIVLMSTGYTLLIAIGVLTLVIVGCLIFVGLLWLSLSLILEKQIWEDRPTFDRSPPKKAPKPKKHFSGMGQKMGTAPEEIQKGELE